MCSGAVIDVLSGKVRHLCVEAVKRAKADTRKALLTKDCWTRLFLPPRSPFVGEEGAGDHKTRTLTASCGFKPLGQVSFDSAHSPTTLLELCLTRKPGWQILTL